MFSAMTKKLSLTGHIFIEKNNCSYFAEFLPVSV
jgi:hypothetical protein